jgi:trimethylamine:corrinoid methyltransferase-like protein
MKTEALLPTLADRSARVQWETKGALDTHARAMQRAHDILAHADPIVFPAEVETRIRAEFSGLVEGCLEMPAGW